MEGLTVLGTVNAVGQEVLDAGTTRDSTTRFWRQDLPGRGGQKVVVQGEIDDLIEEILTQNGGAAFYEHWNKTLPHNLVLDLDLHDKEGEYDLRRIEQTIIEGVLPGLQEVFDRELSSPFDASAEVLVFSSNREGKWSYHLHYPGLWFETWKKAQAWCKKHLTKTLGGIDWVDLGLYTSGRCLRLPGCVKDGMQSPLVFEEFLSGYKYCEMSQRERFKCALVCFGETPASGFLDIEVPPAARRTRQSNAVTDNLIAVPDRDSRVRAIKRAVPEWRECRFVLKDTGLASPVSTYCPILQGHHSTQGSCYAYTDYHLGVTVRCLKTKCRTKPSFEVTGTSFDSETDIIKLLDQSHALVLTGNDCKIIKETFDGLPAKLLSEQAFKRWHKSKYLLGPRNKKEYFSEVWLHGTRRRYERMGFDPSKPINFTQGADVKFYNVWKGFAMEPQENAELSKPIEDYVNQVLCSGRPEVYNYLSAWVADIFHNPGRKCPVSVMMLGGQGTGKGTFVNMILKPMIGNGMCATVFADHELHGNFNTLLMDKLLIFMDEASYGGSKRDHARMKGMQTEKSIVKSAKFEGQQMADTFFRFIGATNGDFPHRADADSRRWFDFVVSDKWKGQHQKFKGLLAHLENPESLPAYMWTLMNTNWDVELLLPPKTDALLSMRLRTLPSVQRWWYHRVEAGDITTYDQVGNPHPPNHLGEEWPEEISYSALYAQFRDSRYFQTGVTLDSFRRLFKQCLPGNRMETFVRRIKQVSTRVFRLPSRQACMKTFLEQVLHS